MLRYFSHIIFLCLIGPPFYAQHLVNGVVYDSEGKLTLEGVSVRVSNSVYAARTDKSGRFQLVLPGKGAFKLSFTHVAYQEFVKEFRLNEQDSVEISIYLIRNVQQLDTVAVLATHRPETLVAKPNYSIFDFDFHEDKLLLLTSERSLSNASIQLSDYSGKIFSSYKLPRQAGEARHFFHDYEGYSDLICKDSVFRIDVINNGLLVTFIAQKEFNRYLLPVADSLNGYYYYSDRWEQYPLFNYYYIKNRDTVNHLLSTVTNTDLMKLYNMEYYYLPPRQQLETRRLASYYKTDLHIIAALMSGFTRSLFYEPLYAPLFILNDTICVFNHHNDFLYHYNKQNQLIDSVHIGYHHPKNWREWKKQLYVDEAQNKVYALFSKNGHHYLKHIHHQSGSELGTYKLKHHSAEKIKIRDGYVYYVYRPFGSTQERFLYREIIETLKK